MRGNICIDYICVPYFFKLEMNHTRQGKCVYMSAWCLFFCKRGVCNACFWWEVNNGEWNACLLIISSCWRRNKERKRKNGCHMFRSAKIKQEERRNTIITIIPSSLQITSVGGRKFSSRFLWILSGDNGVKENGRHYPWLFLFLLLFCFPFCLSFLRGWTFERLHKTGR